jgi:hypothetical protein
MATENPISKTSLWIGRVISILCVLFLLFDSIVKLIKPQFVVEATVKMGYPENTIVGIGIALLVCTILYVIPLTSVLGAIFITGYLGGAVASSVRLEQPFIFPIIFAFLVWLGLYLRDSRLHVLLNMKKQQ